MEALKRIRAPFIALVFAVPLVRIMMQSGTNPNGYSSMPIAMAQYMADVFKGAWPLIDRSSEPLDRYGRIKHRFKHVICSFSIFYS